MVNRKTKLITYLQLNSTGFVLLLRSLQIQRLQVIMPTDEELCLIKEAKSKNPHCPLAPAELCLLTLGQINYLSSRLQLWAFALDYDSLERVCSSTTTSKISIKDGLCGSPVVSMCSGCTLHLDRRSRSHSFILSWRWSSSLQVIPSDMFWQQC